MTISINTADASVSIELPDGADIYEATEACTNALLAVGYVYPNIMNAHRTEAERMEETMEINAKDK